MNEREVLDKQPILIGNSILYNYIIIVAKQQTHKNKWNKYVIVKLKHTLM